ncbi:MAG: hypothetical protein F6J92_34215 [Symploca sp. SIO1A3]|nr:hypothetical protein [Symploca sp. SIO1A3]
MSIQTNIQLGLCDPPEPIYLYVGSGESQGQQYLWYCFDINSERVHPVFQRGLTGYIRELRVTPKEYKGKDATKLDIVVSCDRLYIVRSGIETNFSKGLLLALSQVNDFENPLTIAVAPGEETVIFARLYNATTGERVKAEWNPNAPWLDLIQAINQKLGVSPQPQSPPPLPYRTTIDKNQFATLVSMCTERGIQTSAVLTPFGYQRGSSVLAKDYQKIMQEVLKYPVREVAF